MAALFLCVGMMAGCSESVPPAGADTEIPGDLYSTGEFQTFVPEGWQVYPITDPFAEGRPVKTDCFFLNKGGERDGHVFEKPYIRLTYFGPDEQMTPPVPDPALDRNVQEYPSLHFGELAWNGYAADSYHGKAHIGRFAALWAEQDGHQYQALVWFQSGGESIRLEDADVQAILAGIAPADAGTEQ